MMIDNLTGTASRRCNRILLPALVAFACLLSYIAGYGMACLHLADRAEQEGRRRFLDFLLVAEDLGRQDRRRLTDLICAAAEAEWEDRDAAQIARQTDEQTNAPAGDAH